MSNTVKDMIPFGHMLKMKKMIIFQAMVLTGRRNNTLSMQKQHIIGIRKHNGQKQEEENGLNPKYIFSVK